MNRPYQHRSPHFTPEAVNQCAQRTAVYLDDLDAGLEATPGLVRHLVALIQDLSAHVISISSELAELKEENHS